jgi:hypothetical protein
MMRFLIGGLRWALYLGIAVSLLVILSIIVFGSDNDIDPLCCSVEVLFLLVAAFGGLERLQSKYLKSGEDKVTQSKMPVAESQLSRFFSTSLGRLALGAFSGVIVAWLIILIFTVYVIHLDVSSDDISGSEWAIFLVIIPGFVISPFVASIPGALGGLLGARVATWVENRFQRTINPKIGPIIGGALGVLLPLLVLFLIGS